MSEVDGCAGVGDALGRLVGHVRARTGARWARLGWLGREAEQAEPAARPSSSFPFSIFFFFFLDLNSNLVFKF